MKDKIEDYQKLMTLKDGRIKELEETIARSVELLAEKENKYQGIEEEALRVQKLGETALKSKQV